MKAKLLALSVASIFVCCLAFIFPACQKTDSPDIPGPGPGTEVKVTAGIRGVVVNENNQPVPGAIVKSGTATTTTDNDGIFRFNGISLSASNGFVKVDHPGYFTGSRSFIAVEGRIHNVRIKLLPRNIVGSFTGISGATISLTGGGQLVIPTASVGDAAGVLYPGTVNVAMTWIDPTSSDLNAVIPGDLRGLTTSGEERGLQTFGMLGIELTGSGGQKLNLAPGKSAELTFPIPSSLQATAPATIDLWHFDDSSGRWKQEGTAIKTGTNYVGTVSHFSFWNCDAPFPVVGLCMTLAKTGDGQPLNNVPVRIRRSAVPGNYGYGYTDSVGNLCGAVPKGEPLVLEVLNQCNEVAYSQTVGPFSDNTSLGTISVALAASNTLTITGTLTNCSNANVTNGSVVINAHGGYSYSIPVTNGAFTINILNCSGSLNFSLTGVDYTTMQQGAVVNGNGVSGTVNLGTIQACGVAADEYVELVIDGSSYNFATPGDSLMFNNSADTGAYNTRTSGYVLSGTNNNNLSFTFRNNAAPGIYPLISCYVSVGSPASSSQEVVTASPVVNITDFGPLTSGFIQGNFAIQMAFAGGNKNVSVNFKVRRQ